MLYENQILQMLTDMKEQIKEYQLLSEQLAKVPNCGEDIFALAFISGV